MRENTHKLEVLPKKIYKYYSYDETYNEFRIKGGVYLASPLDFNDLFDCQLNVINNIEKITKVKQHKPNWVEGKLREIGVNDPKESEVRLLHNDQTTIDIVRQKQLEKLGVLCLTTSPNNTSLWGYYTNNKGFCVEYDRNVIIKKLIIGFINNLSWSTTEFLCMERYYIEDFRGRNNKHSACRLDEAERLFPIIDTNDINNLYLTRKDINDAMLLNFIRNVYIKRFGGDFMNYNRPSISEPPKLFYDNNGDGVQSKYYTKGNEWKIEEEYRIILSLGGRMKINLGVDSIKSIRLGCNMSYSHIFNIISILAENNMKDVKLFIMERGSDTGELKSSKISLSKLVGLCEDFKNVTQNRDEKTIFARN